MPAKLVVKNAAANKVLISFMSDSLRAKKHAQKTAPTNLNKIKNNIKNAISLNLLIYPVTPRINGVNGSRRSANLLLSEQKWKP
jgi:hypothetical protein